MKLSPAQQTALVRALHSMEGAAARWAKATRLGDAALYRRIGYEFGTRGGFSSGGVFVDYWGGTNPRIEIKVAADHPVTLCGPTLLAAVRSALRIARDGELF